MLLTCFFQIFCARSGGHLCQIPQNWNGYRGIRARSDSVNDFQIARFCQTKCPQIHTWLRQKTKRSDQHLSENRRQSIKKKVNPPPPTASLPLSSLTAVPLTAVAAPVTTAANIVVGCFHRRRLCCHRRRCRCRRCRRCRCPYRRHCRVAISCLQQTFLPLLVHHCCASCRRRCCLSVEVVRWCRQLSPKVVITSTCLPQLASAHRS